MAKKTAKTDEELLEVVRGTLERIDEDRSRMTQYFDQVLAVLRGDEGGGDRVLFSADSIAKISDSLVKNNQLRVGIANLLLKKTIAQGKVPEDKDDQDLGTFADIGNPFGKTAADDVDN